ncbi:MAG: hypothetical protein KQI35_09325 [Bacteroidetes bacterium]|nr:hypothetical protein [Bacteroidota bacterium]
MHYIQTVQCCKGSVLQRSDQILEVKLKPDCEIEESDAEELQAIFNLMKENGNLILVDHRTPHSFSFKGMLKFKDMANVKALALLTQEGMNTDVAQFISQLITSYPVVVHQNKANCIRWLQSFIPKKKSIPQPENGVVVK